MAGVGGVVRVDSILQGVQPPGLLFSLTSVKLHGGFGVDSRNRFQSSIVHTALSGQLRQIESANSIESRHPLFQSSTQFNSMLIC
jgi:hypothetical protein